MIADLDERQPELDWHWATFDPTVHAQYAGRIVAVYKRHIWGVGKDDSEAMNDASSKPGCPLGDLVLVSVPAEPMDSLPLPPELPRETAYAKRT